MMKSLVLAAGLMVGGSSAASVSMPTAPNRIWVSGHGTDTSGCSTPANPCRTLQYAHDTIVAGGEIDILDPAGYGAVTITKAISIVNDGVGTAGVQAASGTAITVNTGAGDAVFLRGLNVEGLGTANNGILFIGGATLTIEQCTVRDFKETAVLLEPFHTAGSHSVNIQHSIINDNAYGVAVAPSGADSNLRVVVAHSDVSSNTAYGLTASSSTIPVTVQMIDVSTYFNGNVGITAAGGDTTINIGSSSSDSTPQAVNGAVINSFGDNYAPAAFGTTISKH